MKVIIEDNGKFLIRFDKDEEVFAGLLNFATEHNITAAVFTAIGACSEIEIGFFNTTLKDYRRKPLFENKEIISLNGNIAISDGKPVVHAHGIFGDTEFNVVGGHIFKLVVSVTCEVSLTKLEGQAQRILDPGSNLNLLN
jgi:uncharacterized protein